MCKGEEEGFFADSDAPEQPTLRHSIAQPRKWGSRTTQIWFNTLHTTSTNVPLNKLVDKMSGGGNSTAVAPSNSVITFLNSLTLLTLEATKSQYFHH